MKNVGFSLLPFAFLFLFEPGYSLLDPLPDAIGYIIICFAIINLADINGEISEAFKCFRRAAAVSVARFASMFILSKHFVGEEQNVGLLLFTFIFACANLAILIPAYIHLFNGLAHLATFCDGNAPLEHPKRLFAKKGALSRANRSEKLLTLTVVFLILGAAAAVLPELTTLQTHSMYEFVKLLRFSGIVILTPIGIVWLVKWFIYCQRIRRDTAFISALEVKYTENANTRPGLYTTRGISVGVFLITLGAILTIDLYSNGVNVIPGASCYVCFIIGALLLRRYSKKSTPVVISGAIGALLGTVSTRATEHFATNYYFGEINKDIDAYRAYYSVVFSHVAEFVAFLVTAVFIALMLKDVFCTYSNLSREEGHDRFAAELKRGLSVRILLYLLSALLAVGGSAYYIYSQPYYNDAWYFSYSLIIYSALAILHIAAVFSLTSFVTSSVRDRYVLDL